LLGVALALAQAVGSQLVKDAVLRKPFDLSDASSVAATISGTVISSLLAPQTVREGDGQLELYRRIDDLADQRFRENLQVGRRYLDDARLPHRTPQERDRMLEQARLAFLGAAATARNPTDRVEGELLVAGCWLASGAILDMKHSLAVASETCLWELSRELENAQGLSSSMGRQTVADLARLVNDIEGLRADCGAPGTLHVKGFQRGGSGLITLGSIVSAQVAQVEPVFAPSDLVAWVGDLFIFSALGIRTTGEYRFPVDPRVYSHTFGGRLVLSSTAGLPTRLLRVDAIDRSTSARLTSARLGTVPETETTWSKLVGDHSQFDGRPLEFIKAAVHCTLFASHYIKMVQIRLGVILTRGGSERLCGVRLDLDPSIEASARTKEAMEEEFATSAVSPVNPRHKGER
jgi:hypothetical protein